MQLLENWLTTEEGKRILVLKELSEEPFIKITV